MDNARPKERWSLTKGALNVTDAACYMSIRERLLMDMANKGEIPYVRVGREYLFIPDQLDAWLRDHATTSSPVANTWPTRSSQLEPAETPAPEPLIPLKKPPPRLDFQRKSGTQAK